MCVIAFFIVAFILECEALRSWGTGAFRRRPLTHRHEEGFNADGFPEEHFWHSIFIFIADYHSNFSQHCSRSPGRRSSLKRNGWKRKWEGPSREHHLDEQSQRRRRRQQQPLTNPMNEWQRMDGEGSQYLLTYRKKYRQQRLCLVEVRERAEIQGGWGIGLYVAWSLSHLSLHVVLSVPSWWQFGEPPTIDRAYR